MWCVAAMNCARERPQGPLADGEICVEGHRQRVFVLQALAIGIRADRISTARLDPFDEGAYRRKSRNGAAREAYKGPRTGAYVLPGTRADSCAKE
jgi:hypothetical protein